MRRRVLSLFLTLLLCAGGCTAPRDKTDKPATDTTTTTDISTSTDSTVTNITTVESSPLTSISDASTTSHSITGSIPAVDSTTSNSTVTGQSIPSQSSTASTSITNTSSSIDPTTTTTPENTLITFKATVRDKDNKQPVKGVTVTVYHSDINTAPVGSGVTDRNGVVQIEMQKGDSYKVVLSDLPSGYEAANPYSFSTNTVNITIKKSAVYNEADHSGARYEKGDAMTNFTLTDTDGETYRLSDLLKEKQLVILDFWYVSCEPCKEEFPFFESAVQKHSNKIALLAINPFDSTNAINKLRKQLSTNSKTAITFPMFQDTCKLSAGFGVTSYPVTVFIDSSGTILDIHQGAYTTEAAFLSAVERYLN